MPIPRPPLSLSTLSAYAGRYVEEGRTASSFDDSDDRWNTDRYAERREIEARCTPSQRAYLTERIRLLWNATRTPRIRRTAAQRAALWADWAERAPSYAPVCAV